MNMEYRKGQFVGYVDAHQQTVDAVAIEPKRWYALQVYPGREAKIAGKLFRDNISYYYPVATEERVLERRRSGYTLEVRRRVAVPLFCGVIFVPDFVASLEPWLEQDGIGYDGVIGLMRFGDWTAWLSTEEMKRVRIIEQYAGMPVSRKRRLLATGDLVRITDGPFRSFTGKIDKLDSNGRLKVLVAIFGRLTPAEFVEGQLEPVEGDATAPSTFPTG